MLKGIDSNGEMRNVRTDENGILKVAIEEREEQTEEKVNTTLKAEIMTVGTTATSVSIAKKITKIMIANYSETANITLNIGTQNFVIGENIACDLNINKHVENISITSSEDNTKIQVIIEGEE